MKSQIADAINNFGWLATSYPMVVAPVRKSSVTLDCRHIVVCWDKYNLFTCWSKVRLMRAWVVMGHWWCAWATYVQCMSYTYQKHPRGSCSWSRWSIIQITLTSQVLKNVVPDTFNTRMSMCLVESCVSLPTINTLAQPWIHGMEWIHRPMGTVEPKITIYEITKVPSLI